MSSSANMARAREKTIANYNKIIAIVRQDGKAAESTNADKSLTKSNTTKGITTSSLTTDVESCLLRLPDELLLKILCYAMAKEFVFDIERVIKQWELERGTWQEGDGKSKKSYLEFLPFRQMEHYCDWVVVNSTCRAFRLWGKEAFFSSKTFVIQPKFLEALQKGDVKHMSAVDMTTAMRCIRHVLAAKIPRASSLVTLPLYHIFGKLQTLHIHLLQLIPDFQGRYSSFSNSTSKPLTEEFRDLLRANGLQVDRLQMKLVYKEAELDLKKAEHLVDVGRWTEMHFTGLSFLW